MKSIIIVFVLFGIAIADDFKVQTRADLLSYRGVCVEENKVPDSLLDNYKQWKFPNDEITRCYMKCVLRLMNLFDDVDGFKTDNIITQIGSGANSDDVLKCAKRKDDEDVCTWAYRGFGCFETTHGELIKKSLLRS